jgi:hypothetical protein
LESRQPLEKLRQGNRGFALGKIDSGAAIKRLRWQKEQSLHSNQVIALLQN